MQTARRTRVVRLMPHMWSEAIHSSDHVLYTSLNPHLADNQEALEMQFHRHLVGIPRRAKVVALTSMVMLGVVALHVCWRRAGWTDGYGTSPYGLHLLGIYNYDDAATLSPGEDATEAVNGSLPTRPALVAATREKKDSSWMTELANVYDQVH